MFHIVLYQPEIPPNTGNIIRLCANSGAQLHLIAPLGFQLNHKGLRRAGLDYHDLTIVQHHENLQAFVAQVQPRRLLACSTRGQRCYTALHYHPDDAFLFGPETRGLPGAVLESLPESQQIRLPMRPGNRSLNLANTVAIVLYEAWRQQGFAGSD